MSAQRTVFTAGHSNHTLERLVDLLQRAGVTAVADVRTRPYSGRFPWFNGPDLEAGLKDEGIAYFFLGEHLGGRPESSDLYDAEGRADYERMRRTSTFQSGIDNLCTIAERHTVAMLCAEEDPLDCHRGLMIAPELMERGQEVAHLRGDGSVESSADLEARLLDQTGVGTGIVDGLFGGLLDPNERRQLLLDAYRHQARRKAFRLPSPSVAQEFMEE